MKQKYRLGLKEFWIEIISLDERLVSSARPIRPTQLKAVLENCEISKIEITASMPRIFVRLADDTFWIYFRPFLSFVAALELVEEEVKFDWRNHGF